MDTTNIPTLHDLPKDIFLDDSICRNVAEAILTAVDQTHCRGICKEDVYQRIEPILMDGIRSGNVKGRFGYQRNLSTAEAFELILDWLVEYRYLHEVRTRRIHPFGIEQSLYFSFDTDLLHVIPNNNAASPLLHINQRETNSA